MISKLFAFGTSIYESHFRHRIVLQVTIIILPFFLPILVCLDTDRILQSIRIIDYYQHHEMGVREATAQSYDNEAINETINVYENSTLGIRMSYPQNWFLNIDGISHEFVGQGYADGNGSMLFTIQRQNPSLDEFTTKRINAINDSLVIDEFELVYSRPTVLAGYPAHTIMYTLNCEFCVPSKVLEVWTVKENTSYIFHYYTENDNIDTQQTIQMIIDSFEISGPPRWANLHLSESMAQLCNLQPWSGIKFVNLTESIANAIGLKGIRGFLVTEVISNSPADKAGIRGGYIPLFISEEGTSVNIGGDIILEIDGKNTENLTNLLPEEDMTIHPKLSNLCRIANGDKLVADKMVGDELKLTILRDGKKIREIAFVPSPAPDFIPYENALTGIKIMFPSDWYIPQDDGVVIFSRLIGSGGLTLDISPSNNKSLAEITSSQIQRVIDRNLTDFQIIESDFTTLSDSPAYIIKYSYICSSQECSCFDGDTCARPIRKEIEAWTNIGNNTYSVRIGEGNPGSTDNLSYWLQVQKMLDSLHIEHMFESK